MTEMPGSGNRRGDGRAWRSGHSLATAACLCFLTIGGLVIWLVPLHHFAQVTLLLHTVVGIAALVPVTWYSIVHWRSYRKYPLTYIKLLGYFGLFVLAVCAASGLVVTWQALFGIRAAPLWRDVHRWSTVVVVAFSVVHVVAVAVRDRAIRAAAAGASLRAATRRFATVAGAGGVTPLAASAVLLPLLAPPAASRAFPADYELWEPTNPLYAANRPFAPSLARTADNQAIDEAYLSGSVGCGTSRCHEQIVREWRPSAHRYAAMDKAFQAIQLTMARQNGPTSTRYCGGCHDPISLFSGAKNISTSEEALTALHGYREGVSCLACHAVRQTDIRGNAQYTVHAPPRYIGELEYDATRAPAWRIVRDFLIRSYPAPHVDTLSKTMFKKPEYCAACHKQFVDEEINKVGWVQLQNQFDNWRMSRWARNRSDPTKTVECRECHMPLVDSSDPAAGDAVDYNRSPNDGKHRSHRFLGANQLMPELLELEGGAEHTELTHAWLQGRIAIPEIEAKWQRKGVPAVSIELVTPETARAGEPVTVRCVVTSNKVGHDYPTGPLDMIQSWIELIARDDEGRVVFSSGTVDERGFVEPGSFLFKAEPIDQYGNLIDRHNLWEMVGVRQRRSLFPGFSDTAEFSWICPSTVREVRQPLPTDREYRIAAPPGRLHISARLRYRKIDQFLLNYMRSVGYFDASTAQLTAPVTDLHTARAVIDVH